MENSLAPIILFTYRRVPQETIESLLNNALSSKSKLFIYSDGYKNDVDKNDVLEVRNYINTIDGFNTITIFESDKNKGLANSIIAGVSEIINRYQNAIVLEDDLIVSANFLEYMNNALNFYKIDEKIWSISGYSPRIPSLHYYDKDLYLSVRGSSWGWATWKDRWDSVDWDVKDFTLLKKDKNIRRKFEFGGNDLYKMLELQVLGKIDSWAIRWCFSQFLQTKYTVYPIKSKIINNGFHDFKGTHNSGNSSKWDVDSSNISVHFESLIIDEELLECYKKYHDLSLFTKVGYFLKKYGGYKIIKKIIGR